MSWADGPALGFDVESTGPDPEEARIVSFALVWVDGDTITQRHQVVFPGVTIPDEAIAVHGITNEMAEQGIDSDAALVEILAALREAWAKRHPVVGFNISYDLTVLDRECGRHLGQSFTPSGPVADGIVLDRYVDRYRKGSRKLTAACEHYGVTLENAHSADADALAAVLVVHAICRRYPTISKMTLQVLWKVQRISHRLWAANFERHLAEKGEPEPVSGDWPIRMRQQTEVKV